MGRIFEKATDIAIRHGTAFAIGGAIWFWVGIAVYARFIDLPDMPTYVRQGFFWSSVAYNAIWWAGIYPQIDKRRKARAAIDTKEN